GEVQVLVNCRIRIPEVDCWRNDVMDNRHCCCYCFYNPGGSKEMAGHRFCCADVQFVGVFAEESQNGFYLSDVTKRCGSAVHIDIVNVRGLKAGFIDSLFHHVDSSHAVR